jgi:hypothetical protein
MGEQKANMLECSGYGSPLLSSFDYGQRGRDPAVDVTASTLYEAVALGLKAIRGDDWSGGFSEEYAAVQVLVTDIPVEHTVMLKNFSAWLQRSAGSPKDVIARSRVREILGA